MSGNLHDDERPFVHPDMPEGMTQEEYAAWLHEHRHEREGWEPVEAEISPSLASVVSVRLRRGELGAIERAAEAAGLKVSTFIRQSALAASGVVNIDAARRDIDRLRRQVDVLAGHLAYQRDQGDAPKRAA